MPSPTHAPVAEREGSLLRHAAPLRLAARVKAAWSVLFPTPEEGRRASRSAAIADLIPHLVWASAADGTAVYFNQRWLEYTGLKASDPGFRWPLLVHPDDLDKILLKWNQCRLSASPFEMEYRLRRHDGEYRWHVVRATPLLDARGDIDEWVGTCTDIHEHTLQLEKTRQAEESLQNALRTRDEFLATLSHELRTPMNVILGWVQILRSDQSPAIDIRHVLDILDRNARSQIQLINDLLDVSRIINGKLRIQERPLDMESITLAGLEPLRLAARQKSIRVETHFDHGLRTVVGDPDRLQQVVWNLVSNAVKFTPRGGAIVIALRRRASHVVLEVQDTGQGIDPDFLPLVFERFRQEDGSATRRQGGLGLGLAISKHIVEMHGGTLGAHSSGRGQGALFVMTLPVRSPLRPPKPLGVVRRESSDAKTGNDATSPESDDDPPPPSRWLHRNRSPGLHVVSPPPSEEPTGN